MKKKKICLMITVVAIIALLLSYIISYANSNETIYVNLTKLNTNGVGYGIGNPTVSNTPGQPLTNAYIWNLTTYDSDNISNVSREQRNLYCIKANYGDSWNENKDKIVAYNLSYDLQNDRQMLLNKIVDNGKDIDDILKTLLSESGYYRELLWILDNSYIEGQTDKKEFLNNIGIKYDSSNKVYYYEAKEGYDYSDLVTPPGEYVEESLVTDADIKAVQRAAIWYYTNYLGDKTQQEVFNQKGKQDWLSISSDGNTYQELADYNKFETEENGPQRNEQAQIIYNYLIDAAAKNANNYTTENNYNPTGEVNVKTEGLSQTTEGKYKLNITKIGTNYVVGPIVINKTGTLEYGISLKITNQNNTDINYTFTDAQGTDLGTTDIKTLVGKEDGFYISVPVDGIDKVNVKIDITQEKTKKTLWLNGSETENEITLNAEQPIVEVIRTSETIPTEFEAQPDEFDLALRKYITQLNGVNVANTRIPTIDTSTLTTGTTATYKHRKDPVVVKDKDEVTYTITIYNEGNKAGYASKIVDQLPVGLINSPSNSATVISKDKSGNEKNTYTLAYNTTTNQITLTIVNTAEKQAENLEPYKAENLDYETIEIKCRVAQEADTKNQIVLTNVAWIEEAYNSETQEIITTEIGKDRDSEPATSPNVNKDNMQNYKGNTENQENLADNNYFYKGEQDDDDFEKLVIMPIEKIFDLALFKHIAAISSDQTFGEGEYVTDNKNIDGKYLRAPVVTNIDKETGKITYKQDSKEALVVKTNDYVLYTIRVYNEGEVNGYASKIKDTLPIGLEFVVENEEYNGIWNLDGLDEDGRQIISTTWYAKGQGAELNTVEGDPNYKANLLNALNKEGEISKENPDYIDAQVLCKVVEEETSDRILVNYAQIADDSDENGDPIDDVDSTPDKWIDGEDDQDIERIKVKNNEEPEIHKGVKDVENQDSGYNSDEIHKWVIESDIPENIEDYKLYTIVDNIDYRLKFEGTEKVSVKIGNTKLEEETDYKISFEENQTGIQDKTTSGTLKLTFIDTVNSIQASSKMLNNAGKVIEVTFETTFAKDENGNLLAGMGEQIENQAKLEYENENGKNTDESEKPEVHTGGVILYKYYEANGEKVSLEGATFGIYKTEEDAKNNKNVIKTAVSDEKGIVRFIGLEYGGDAMDNESNLTPEGIYDYDADTASTKYWIAEIEAPEGYEKYKGIIEVTIDKDSYNEEQIEYEVKNDKLNFDLALRKFITKVQEKEVTTRVPQVNIDNGKITYQHPKDPIIVHTQDVVTYTIRVYNEGNVEGYASEVTDDIPEYLEFLPEETINVDYMWKMYNENGEETTNAEDAVKVKTTYLSKENGKDKLLKAFDGTTVDYKDIKIAFRVKDPNSNTTIITNHAQISDDTDIDGDPIEDIDSKPNEWNEGEDDQDIENVKVEYFDLALLKFVSKVIIIEDGKETINETGYNGHEDPEPVVKVELHKKKLKDVVVKFGYGITITNEGEIPGYATEITDYVPEGLRFEAADNPLWTDEGNNVISTKQLENKLLQPGESTTVEVILTWINSPDNLALKTNTAEISEDDNEYDVPDKDSTPDNKVEGEDDIDIAKVILAISTGAVATYFKLTIGLLAVVLVGVVLIKKFII